MTSAGLTPTEISPGTVIAGCRVEGVAGRGGMGLVYRATQLGLERVVALKVVAGDRALDPSFRARFEQESRLAASIDHPNVIDVHAAGEEDGRLYLVMRYVDGVDLHRLLQREGRLEPARAAVIVAQVAGALDAAHAAGLVHRDVKPANVLLAGSHAWLGDFGLTREIGADAHITESGVWVGTVDFMSPEHLRGARCDARSDVYSLGCLLYTLVTGEPPFRRGTVPATAYAHAHEAPPRAPGAMDRVVRRALAKDPADRFWSAGDLGRAAVAAAAGESVRVAERTVARGAAAPDEAPTRWLWAAGLDATPPTRELPQDGRATSRRAPGPADAQDGGAPSETRHLFVRSRERRLTFRRPRLGALVALATGALAAAGVVAVGLFNAQPDLAASHRPTAPLSDGDVRAAAGDFADAVATEDARALARVLAHDVQRVFPTDVQRGRAAVLAAYRGQFRSADISGYELSDVSAHGGRAGRAAGRYTLRRGGRPDVAGTLVLGVVRERGEPRIALIAARPD